MMPTLVRFDPTALPLMNAADVSPDACRVYLWEHTHSPEMLTAMASRIGIELPELRHRKRFLEKASTLIMLACTVGKQCKLMHTEEGVPYIASEHGLRISISHTDNAYALSISRKRHGIDIERISPRPHRLRTRFLRADEQELHLPFPFNEPEVEATALWCAKEAAFKAFSTPELTLLEQVYLQRSGNGLLSATPVCPNGIERTITLSQSGNLLIAVCG